MILLLFTDDMAILANSPEELQNQLDTVFTIVRSEALTLMLIKPKSSYLGNAAGYYLEKSGRITETILRLSINLTILATFLIVLVASIWTKNT